jgi:Ras family
MSIKRTLQNGCVIVVLCIIIPPVIKFALSSNSPSFAIQKVTYEQGKALADEFGIKFFETSAKLNSQVDVAFMSIARDIVARLKENPEHYAGAADGANVSLQKDKVKTAEKKSCC